MRRIFFGFEVNFFTFKNRVDGNFNALCGEFWKIVNEIF